MKKILIRLTPLEPYFFGDENSIKFDNSNAYFVTSMAVPSAMTVMGMLRYTLLEQSGLLRHGAYTPEETRQSAELIGRESFRPGDAESYGVLQRVSPLFLMQGQDIYIKTPKNHRGGDVYAPIPLGKPVETSFGLLALPEPGMLRMDALVSEHSYIQIRSGEIREDLFRMQTRVNINCRTSADGLIKKGYCCLKEGFSFAVVAELAEGAELRDSICYMGRERSAFRMQVSEGFCLEEAVTQSPVFRGTDVLYALSDLVLPDSPQYRAFAMVGVKNLRYLSTAHQEGRLRISQSPKLHSVITAGSVFYGDARPELLGNDRFGINQILKLGGNRE